MARKPALQQDAPEAEHVEIPNDDTVIIEDGVTVSSPDAPDPDVKPSEPAGAEEPSLLEAVEAAVKDERDPSDPEQAKAGDGDGTTDGEGDGDGDDPDDQSFLEQDPTDDEVQHYSKKAQARIRALVDQRNEANARAGQVEPILNFLHQNDIPQQDLDVILDLTARLRHGDFAGFLQGVQPYVNLAMQYTGQMLPQDLEEKVRQGYVSPEIARELAQARAQQNVGQQQALGQQRKSEQEAGAARAESVRYAITNWERETRAKDPDYDLKADVVRRTAQALMQEKGVPRTPEEALACVNEAYAETNAQMKRLRPQPKATARTPSSTASKGGAAPVSEPKSMMEAALQGLQQHARG